MLVSGYNHQIDQTVFPLHHNQDRHVFRKIGPTTEETLSTYGTLGPLLLSVLQTLCPYGTPAPTSRLHRTFERCLISCCVNWKYLSRCVKTPRPVGTLASAVQVY